MSVKLSKTSKLGCLSWSLQAIDTCPGSKGSDGKLVPACSGCYATSGNYRYANVKLPRLHNRTDWEREDWVDDMVTELDSSRYFRWFDSGDCYSVKLAEKILQVMERTPWCQHWLPTRMHKFPKFHDVFQRMQSLANVVVRYSSDSITGERVVGHTTSTIVPSDNLQSAGSDAYVCPAYTREGKCGPCKACWSQSVSVIAYVGHGRSMVAKQRKVQLIAKA
jgi:hypothetical protein